MERNLLALPSNVEEVAKSIGGAHAPHGTVVLKERNVFHVQEFVLWPTVHDDRMRTEVGVCLHRRRECTSKGSFVHIPCENYLPLHDGCTPTRRDPVVVILIR